MAVQFKSSYTNNTPPIASPESVHVDLRLDKNKTPVLTNISEEEYNQIDAVIDYFENYKYLKDYIKAINMISQPNNQEEQEWLDHFFGNDLTSINNDEPSPGFFNKDNYHILVGYAFEAVS